VEAADPAVTLSAVLRPAVNALVPEELVGAERRIRNTAVWGAIAAWLLPPLPRLATDTTTHRAVVCAVFVLAAFAAHFVLAVGATVFVVGHGAVWGLWFVAFAAVVVGATAARRRLVRHESGGTDPGTNSPLRRGPRVLAWLAWFMVSIFVLREWVVQAMAVPTASMQPTIMGARPPATWGDHLLVENFSYLVRDPKRWDIAVFRYPLMRERFFVKRVVGLPGERVEIKGGDLWIDGKIPRKPPAVQETLWRERFDSSKKKITAAFQSTGPWKPLSDREVLASPKGETTYAQFVAKELGPDLRVGFTVPGLVDGVEPRARILSRGVPVELVVTVYGADLSVAGASTAVVTGFHGEVRLELCVADGEAWAVVNGSEVARAAVPNGVGKNSVEIGAKDGPVSFRDVRVDEDIVYVATGTAGTWQVPADSFFFVGDNQTKAGGTPSSYDSRLWTLEEFKVAGQSAPIYAAVQVPDETTGAMVQQIRVKDGKYRFQDVDGVPRELPVASTTRTSGVPAPFVPRSDLVGRALMVFLPFSTDDAGFRPRLLP
jgi:signal peptidase I